MSSVSMQEGGGGTGLNNRKRGCPGLSLGKLGGAEEGFKPTIHC